MGRTQSGLPGIYNASSSAISLQTGDGCALGTDNQGYLVVVQAVKTNTNTPGVNQSFLGAVTKALVKSTPGNVFSVYGINQNASVRYLQIHDKATAPAGADIPVASFAIPGGTVNSPGVIIIDNSFFTSVGQSCSNGIGWAISTTAGSFTDAATSTEHLIDIRFI